MKTVFICVCSPERLNQYKVLFQSMNEHCSEVDTLLYYGGADPGEVGPVADISGWVKNSPYTDNWYTYTYLRPRAILDAFSRGYEKVFLLGSDTEFFNKPHYLYWGLEQHDCLVTLYTHEPYLGDDLYPNDWQTLEVGQINADLIGFKNTSETITFLEWMERTLKEKIVYRNKIYLDQGWFSMCFSFLPRVNILRHLGYNVANYNMHNRGMRKNRDGKWVMKDGSPLVLFHYAGFIKGKEEKISKHQDRYTATGNILEFLRQYGDKL